MTSLKITPPIIAHRGASGYAPENTLAAFQKAQDLGAKWIEFDLMLAASGEVIVFHDETVDRTTNAKGPVSEFSYPDLAKLDAGSWFSPDFAGEKIPTLKEVLTFLAKSSLSANLEIKPLPGQEEETVASVLTLLNSHWPKNAGQPLLSSFSLKVLEKLRQRSSEMQLGLLLHNWDLDWKAVAKELEVVSINVSDEMLTKETTADFKNLGKSLLCYTVNDVSRAKTLFSWGVDAVFTDYPDKILESLSDN